MAFELSLLGVTEFSGYPFGILEYHPPNLCSFYGEKRYLVNNVADAFGKDRMFSTQTLKRAKVWCCPDAGTYKLNTDGSSKGNPGKGGVGGLIRDSDGVWMCGYFGKISQCTSLEAEIKSIYLGLVMVKSREFPRILIETDASEAVELIKEHYPIIHHLRALVEDCKTLLEQCRGSIQHIPREANKCADYLANMGTRREDEFVILEHPPEEMTNLVLAEMSSHVFDRLS